MKQSYDLIIDNVYYKLIIDDCTSLCVDCHVYLNGKFYLGFGVDTRYYKQDVFIYREYDDGRYSSIDFSNINEFNTFASLVNELYKFFKTHFKRLR